MPTILLFILAFLIRLINLDQSLWLDEAVVAKVVRTISLFQIPLQFSPGDFHPPLYYLFISLWTGIFGSSEVALRAPSIIFSLIAGFFVYKSGILIKDKKTGFWAAAFFLFNPLIVYYSQEVRMYMMATALLSIALYYFILLIKEFKISNSKFKNIFLFNLFSAFAMFTFYGSVFFITAMIVIYSVISTKRSAWRNLSIPFAMMAKALSISWGLIISLLLLSPLLIQQLQTAKTGLQDVKNWSLVLGKAELKNVFMIFIKFTSGRLSWFPKWSYYLVAGSWSIVVGLFMALGMRKKSDLLFCLFSQWYLVYWHLSGRR